jgi:hypothetical protein
MHQDDRCALEAAIVGGGETGPGGVLVKRQDKATVGSNAFVYFQNGIME